MRQSLVLCDSKIIVWAFGNMRGLSPSVSKVWGGGGGGADLLERSLGGLYIDKYNTC